MACPINTVCIDKIKDGINKIGGCLHILIGSLFNQEPANGTYIELQKALQNLCDTNLTNAQTSAISEQIARDLAKLFHDYMETKFANQRFLTQDMKNSGTKNGVLVLSALATCGWYKNNTQTKNLLKSRINDLFQGIYDKIVNLCVQVSSLNLQCGPINETPTCWDVISNWIVYHPCLDEHNLGYTNLDEKYIFRPMAMEDGSIQVELKKLQEEVTIKDLLCNPISCTTTYTGDDCEGNFFFIIKVGTKKWVEKDYSWTSIKDYQQVRTNIENDMVSDAKEVFSQKISAFEAVVTTALTNRKKFISNILSTLTTLGSQSSELKTVAILYMMTGDLKAGGLEGWPATFAQRGEICNQLLCYLWNHTLAESCGGAPVYNEITKQALCNTGIMATPGNYEKKDWPVQTIPVPFARVTDKWNFDSEDPKVLNASAIALLKSIDDEINLGTQCSSSEIIDMVKDNTGKVTGIVIRFCPSAMWKSVRGTIPTNPTVGGDGNTVPGIPDCSVSASREIMENIVKLLNVTRPPTCKKSIFHDLIMNLTQGFTLPPIGGPGVSYQSGADNPEYKRIMGLIESAFQERAEEAAKWANANKTNPGNEDMNAEIFQAKIDAIDDRINNLRTELNNKFGQKFCTYTWPNETPSAATQRFGDDVMARDCKVYPIVFEHWERLKLILDMYIFAVIASRVFTADNQQASKALKDILATASAMKDSLQKCGIEKSDIPIQDSDKVFSIDSCNIEG